MAPRGRSKVQAYWLTLLFIPLALPYISSTLWDRKQQLQTLALVSVQSEQTHSGLVHRPLRASAYSDQDGYTWPDVCWRSGKCLCSHLGSNNLGFHLLAFQNWLWVLLFPTVGRGALKFRFLEAGPCIHPSHLDLGTHSFLVVGQEWKQDMKELMLWMEERWPTAADEPFQTHRNILQKLKSHDAAVREVLAACGHVEDLQQVGVMDREGRAGPPPLQIQHILPCMFPWSMVAEGSTPVTMELETLSCLLH